MRRVWPSQVRVSVLERQAYARWDDTHLLSNRGVVFEADSAGFETLPRVHGYRDQSVELLQRFVALRQRFYEAGIELSELHEDSKGALNLVLDGKLKVSLGSDRNAYKVDHMLAVYGPQIRPHKARIKHIDFRYNNGFAIAWKEDPKEPSAAKKRGKENV